MYNMQSAREEFAITGESWFLNAIKNCRINTIFDVGANCGEWARLARETFPSSTIHSFEIVSDTYVKFLQNKPLDKNDVPNGFGLSNFTGILPVKFCTTNDTFSTHLEKMAPGTLASSQFEWRNCFVVTGDSYVDSRKIDYIDLLKIDTEGAEGLVLEGLKETLASGKIGAIQFEYGTANIVARWLLMDAYELLEPAGFMLGKLQNGSVQFAPYSLSQETFNGPNIVAVHRTRLDIFEALRRAS